MKTSICITALVAICTISGAYGDHKMGASQACFYDSNPGKNKWHYYYCGAQNRGCNGKSGNGKNDKHYTKYHGDSFTFQTAPKDKYWCCGGSSSEAGRFVQGDKWIINTKTERMQVTGGSCNKQIQTDICGETHEVTCTVPDKCSAGLILRNDECIKPCADDEVFDSPTSNTCIACETTVHQGPALDRQSCIKCDKDTEFFNRETKRCINKKGLQQYSKEALKECWRCPRDLYKNCMETITLVNKMGKSGKDRLKEINALASFDNPVNLVEKCHLE